MVNNEGGAEPQNIQATRGTIEEPCEMDRFKGPYSHKINSDKHK